MTSTSSYTVYDVIVYNFVVKDVCDVFFFNDTATTKIYTYLHTLSLHDALPISRHAVDQVLVAFEARIGGLICADQQQLNLRARGHVEFRAGGEIGRAHV